METKEIESNIIEAEYSRLYETMVSFLNKSFDDFKLLAAVSAILIIWKETTSYFASSPFTIFIGCIVFLMIVALIAFKNLLRNSFIGYIRIQLVRYEKVIREKSITACENNLFVTFKEWQDWHVKRYMWVTVAFSFCTMLTLLGVPFLIMLKAVNYSQDAQSGWYPWVFAVLVFILLSIYLIAGQKNWKEITTNKQ